MGLLSGKKHYQYSGVCIFKAGDCVWDYSERVELKMHNLSDDEIRNYVEMENPIHVAGAYKFESLDAIYLIMLMALRIQLEACLLFLCLMH